MIEELDVESMRQEGLRGFQDAIRARINGGGRPDAALISACLLRAMEPLVKAIIGDDANPEDHILVKVHSTSEDPQHALHYTEAEGKTDLGNVVVEAFMDLQSKEIQS